MIFLALAVLAQLFLLLSIAIRLERIAKNLRDKNHD